MRRDCCPWCRRWRSSATCGPVNLSIDWTTWLLFYAGFYVLQILLTFYTLGSFRWEVLMLAAVSFPIYLQALYNALIGKEQKWHVTGSKTRADSPFKFIIPQMLVSVFLACTSVMAIWRDLSHRQFSLPTARTVTNSFILRSFMVVALREAYQSRHPRPIPVVAADAAADDLPPAETEPAFGQAAPAPLFGTYDAPVPTDERAPRAPRKEAVRS